jgi:hypothetical protein
MQAVTIVGSGSGTLFIDWIVGYTLAGAAGGVNLVSIRDGATTPIISFAPSLSGTVANGAYYTFATTFPNGCMIVDKSGGKVADYRVILDSIAGTPTGTITIGYHFA